MKRDRREPDRRPMRVTREERAWFPKLGDDEQARIVRNLFEIDRVTRRARELRGER